MDEGCSLVTDVSGGGGEGLGAVASVIIVVAVVAIMAVVAVVVVVAPVPEVDILAEDMDFIAVIAVVAAFAGAEARRRTSLFRSIVRLLTSSNSWKTVRVGSQIYTCHSSKSRDSCWYVFRRR